MLAGGCGVGDAALVAEAAVPGSYPFAVLAGVDDDGVTGLGQLGGVVDGVKGPVGGPVGSVGSGRGDMKIGGQRPGRLSGLQRLAGMMPAVLSVGLRGQR